MKHTAIMELIEYLSPILDNGQFDFSYKAGVESAIAKANNLLEKEKEQIIEAVDYASNSDDKEYADKYYYNETYKQD